MNKYIQETYPEAAIAPSIVGDDPTVSELWSKWLGDTGWTQQQLAKKAGLSTSAVGHIIQGARRPSFQSTALFLEAVSRKCGYDISEMYLELHRSLLRETT